MGNEKKMILYVLEKISDLNFQKDVWVIGAYWDQVTNFGEAVNTLEDFGFFEDFESGIIAFSIPSAQKNLAYFIKELLAYEEPANPKKMLEDPSWIAISENAGKLKIQLEKMWELR